MARRIVRKMLRALILLALPKLRDNRKQSLNNHSKLSINLVTSWNTPCGIATYSSFIAEQLRRKADVNIVEISGKITSNSPYLFILGFEAGRTAKIVHVQFEYGLFSDLKLFKKRFSNFGIIWFYWGLAFSKTPVFTTFHEIKKKKEIGKFRTIYDKVLHNLVLQLSDGIIVHTLESKLILEKEKRCTPSKIKIIPHGMYEKPIFLDREECKRKMNLNEKKVILLPGFITSEKGHDLLLSILPMLDDNVHLLIAGGARTPASEDYLKQLKHLTTELACEDRVTFTGYFTDMPLIMNAADIAVLPYRQITDSGILRLLIAFRVPTITSDLPAFIEVKHQYDCIELFQQNNKTELLQKINFLLNNEVFAENLRKNCLTMWELNRWSAIAQKHLAAYFEALSNHPDAIYNDPVQKERIDWLKHNRSGVSLEIGCAGGFVTNYTNSDVGLDLDVIRIKHAKAKYPNKEFVIGSASALPFKQKAFDCILIPEILEHVRLVQAEKIISEAKTVGQKIVITVPNAGKDNYNKILVENPEHLWLPTNKIIKELVKDCNTEYSLDQDFILVKWPKK